MSDLVVKFDKCDHHFFNRAWIYSVKGSSMVAMGSKIKFGTGISTKKLRRANTSSWFFGHVVKEITSGAISTPLVRLECHIAGSTETQVAVTVS
jgi:hypothetical protein